MGSADVVPGVSGGTMAFILGIYQRLINAIKSFDLVWAKSILKLDMKVTLNRPDFAFLIPLAAGIFLALMFFTRVISLPDLIRSHPEWIYSLFFGLIAGSIMVLAQQTGRFSGRRMMALLAGLLIGFTVVNLAPVNVPNTGWAIFICGVLAATAMMLPGVSGSFILLLLQKYAYIFDAIGHFKFAIVIPFVLGVAVGLMLFSRVLAWLLLRYYRVTVLFILGVLTASLWVVWPFQNRQFEIVRQTERLVGSEPYWPTAISTEVAIAIGIMICGFLLVLILDYGKSIHKTG